MLEKKESRTPAMQLFRILAMIGIFIAVGVLFWKNFEHSLTHIESKQNLWDQTQTLNKAQKQAIYNFAKRIKRKYGLELQIKITREKTMVPKLDGKTIFIGLCPPKHEAIIIFPPLAKKAVGDNFIIHLQKTHFKGYWPDNWPEGLGKALGLIEKQLSTVGQ
ncbi:MAG: hypothetical protein ACQES5_01605 [Thermodesulfobacteriota bacterium]